MGLGMRSNFGFHKLTRVVFTAICLIVLAVVVN